VSVECGHELPFLWVGGNILLLNFVVVVFVHGLVQFHKSQCVAVGCCVLQFSVVCCSVLQCIAVCCSVLQCVSVRCSALQCVAVCCSVLQCVAV